MPPGHCFPSALCPRSLRLTGQPAGSSCQRAEESSDQETSFTFHPTPPHPLLRRCLCLTDERGAEHFLKAIPPISEKDLYSPPFRTRKPFSILDTVALPTRVESISHRVLSVQPTQGLRQATPPQPMAFGLCFFSRPLHQPTHLSPHPHPIPTVHLSYRSHGAS